MSNDDDNEQRSASSARPALRPAMPSRPTTTVGRRPATEITRRPAGLGDVTDDGVVFAEASGPSPRSEPAPPRPKPSPSASTSPPLDPPAPPSRPRTSVPPGGLDPAVEPSSARRAAPSGPPLDPPMPPARPKTSLPPGGLDPAVEPTTPRRPAPSSVSLDPPVPPARPKTKITGGALDPPVEPSSRRPVAPGPSTGLASGSLDPALPPARPKTKVSGGVLDPAVEPSGRRPVAPGPSSGVASGGLDPVLPPAGAQAAVIERPRRSRVSTRQTVLRAGVVGVVGVMALALVARVTGGDDASRAPLSLDEERAVADAWRKEGLTRMGGARNDDASVVVGQTVSGFGRMLGERLGGRSLRAVVVEAPTASEIFSLPDGTVVVTTGLLSKLSSHAEFLALVAHATSHVALGHTATALGSVVPTLRAATQAGTSSVVDGTMTPLLREPFSADDEEAADAFAVKAMLSTGWDTTAYERALKIAASSSGSWASRHGVDDARLQRRGAVEPSGRAGEADYRTGVLLPLGVVRATPPPSPAAAPGSANDDDEEDEEDRSSQRAHRTHAAPSSDKGQGGQHR